MPLFVDSGLTGWHRRCVKHISSIAQCNRVTNEGCKVQDVAGPLSVCARMWLSVCTGMWLSVCSNVGHVATSMQIRLLPT